MSELKTQPLGVFAQNAHKMLQEIDATKLPLVLTVDGRAKLVVQDVDSYRCLVERLETIEGIYRGLQDHRTGKSQPVDLTFREIRNRKTE